MVLVDDTPSGAIVTVKDRPSRLVTGCCRLHCGIHDVCEHHRGELTGGRSLDLAPNGELDHLVGDVASVRHDPREVVGTLHLDVAGAGDDLGQQATAGNV